MKRISLFQKASCIIYSYASRPCKSFFVCFSLYAIQAKRFLMQLLLLNSLFNAHGPDSRKNARSGTQNTYCPRSDQALPSPGLHVAKAVS